MRDESKKRGTLQLLSSLLISNDVPFISLRCQAGGKLASRTGTIIKRCHEHTARCGADETWSMIVPIVFSHDQSSLLGMVQTLSPNWIAQLDLVDSCPTKDERDLC